MGFFSAITSVVKKVASVPLKVASVATLPSRTVLNAVARAATNVGVSRSSGVSPSTPAAPINWRGAPVTPVARSYNDPSLPPPTPQQSSWLPAVAAAVQQTPPSVQQQPQPYPGFQPYVPGQPAPSAQQPTPAPTWTAPSPPPPSYNDYGGGGGGGGGNYGGGFGPYASRGDPSDYDLQPSEYSSDSTDDEQLGDADASAIDYAAFLGDAGGLGDWKSSLVSVVKGAASGALNQAAGQLVPTAPKPTTLATSAGNMSTGMKLAIGAAVAAPVLFLAMRHSAPARAHNPRRRRRAKRR